MTNAAGDGSRRRGAALDVEALEQLAQHLALGGDELRMELAFHRFEVFCDQRAGSKCLDPLTQEFKGGCTALAGATRGDMKY